MNYATVWLAKGITMTKRKPTVDGPIEVLTHIKEKCGGDTFVRVNTSQIIPNGNKSAKIANILSKICPNGKK